MIVSSSCQQPKLQAYPEKVIGEVTDSNMENATDFPKIGEHHPDGPTASLDHRSQGDTLNFGWFSLPPAKKGFVSREDQPKSPAEFDGGPDHRNSFESNQRPLSKEGQRPDSQQRTTPQQCASSSGCAWPESQIPGPQHCMGEPGIVASESQEQGFGQISHNQRQKSVRDENMIVEWPMSILARGHEVRQSYTPSLYAQPRTPVGRSEMREVPPTPLPPLQWQGYQSCSRPTYSSWHDMWYQSQDAIPTITRGMDTNNSNLEKDTGNKGHDKETGNMSHGKNTGNMSHGKNTGNMSHSKNAGNKSNDKNTGNKNRARSTKNNLGKNTNNNNDMDETLTIGSNNQFVACNYSADGNNNNWMIVDDHGSSPRTQVTTIPPYEQSNETVPSFYSPSMVMKWEDTEDQFNSMKEKKSFKQTSLMKRIRSSFFQIWSILSCLKNQEDETAPQGCRPFKYDRFDYDDKPINNEQSGRD